MVSYEVPHRGPAELVGGPGVDDGGDGEDQEEGRHEAHTEDDVAQGVHTPEQGIHINEVNMLLY